MSLNPATKRRQSSTSVSSLGLSSTELSALAGAASATSPNATNGGATSPPPSGLGAGGPPPAKRTKSSSQHPLRQASFHSLAPAGGATGSGGGRAGSPGGASSTIRGSRSPSVDSSVVSGAHGPGSTATGVGRKRKTDTANASVVGGANGQNAGAGRKEEEEDDDDDDEGNAEGEAVMLAGIDGNNGSGMPDEEYNRWRVGILIDSLSPEQYDRYTLYLRSTLNKSSIRKLANQVLNQSTTPMVVTTIAGYTKIFVVEIIERAREIQKLWGREGQPLGPDEVREAWRRWMRDGEGSGVFERGSGGGRPLFR